MDRIGVRELRQHASRYLDRVAAGELIEITDRGRPVARLVPITPDPWQDLIDSAEVVPAAAERDVRDFTPIATTEPSTASERLNRLRADER